MSYDSERADIEGAYAASPITGVEFYNDGHEISLGGVSDVPAIRLTIQSGAAFQASIGSPSSNIARHAGVAFFEIYTEGGKGSAEGRVIAQQIEDIYRNKNFASIKCRIPSIVPRNDEPPFKIMLVSVPFERDEFNA